MHLTGGGLSDLPAFGPPTTGPLGISSFAWGSERNATGIYGTHNEWSWQNARDYQWTGLTAQTRLDRFIALTNMFRAFGQVVHLVEDDSSPQHVRNEEHVVTGKAIEKFGVKHFRDLNYQHAVLPWKADGFTRLRDFWDRDKYTTGNSSALVADANALGESTARLGLAEFINGNFLGAHHLYPEYYLPQWHEYYAFPSRDHSTNYKQVKANPLSGLDNVVEDNGHVGKGIYVRKTTDDGVEVRHHARVSYLGAKKIPGLTGPAFCTVNDSNGLHDYYSILIPKAVEYSAGVLDYYFRGKLEVCMTAGGVPGTYNLKVTHRSGQDLKGGEFRLYYDAAPNGARAQLTGSDFISQYTTLTTDQPRAAKPQPNLKDKRDRADE